MKGRLAAVQLGLSAVVLFAALVPSSGYIPPIGFAMAQRHRLCPERVGGGGRSHWRGPVMRDRSAVSGFAEGASVKVVKDVFTRGGNAVGLIGRVETVWEKCMVDPTCCCAELSMEEAGVKVVFELSPSEAARFDKDRLDGMEGGVATLATYFGEDELAVVTELNTKTVQ